MQGGDIAGNLNLSESLPPSVVSGMYVSAHNKCLWVSGQLFPGAGQTSGCMGRHGAGCFSLGSSRLSSASINSQKKAPE